MSSSGREFWAKYPVKILTETELARNEEYERYYRLIKEWAASGPRGSRDHRLWAQLQASRAKIDRLNGVSRRPLPPAH